jgi:outer membrane protein assembly factor BamB
MAVLELQSSDGTTETRELSRRQPLSIGKQPANDIAIPDDNVAALHCRIAWNKSAYEVTAAVQGGVDLNGKLIERAVLKSGDVLRIGPLDLVFRDSSGSRRTNEKSDEESEKRAARRQERRARRGKDQDDEEDLSLFEGPVVAESLAEMISQPEVVDSESDEMSGLMLSRNLSQGETISRGGRSVGERQGPAIADELDDLKRRVSTALRADRVRPGEQDVFRSPLVLGLGGGGLVVLLLTATIWFLMGRQVARRHFDRAEQEFKDQQFTQAIQSYESFLEKYQTHPLRTEAQLGVGRARIQKELAGATPSWKRGLEQLEEFITEHRNDADFKALQPGIAQFAEQIGYGAAKAAEQTRDPELLTVSADATRRLEQFGDPQNPPTTALEQISLVTEQANAAIRKQKTVEEALAAIDAAAKQKQPIVMLQQRAKLLQSYPDVANMKRLRDALQQAISLEKSQIETADLNQAADTSAEADDVPCVIPVEHTRSRTDEAASGRYVYALAQDACFAVDSVTGEVAWRKLTGEDPPFFPQLTSGAQPGLLLGESGPPALTLRHAETGALLWRQQIPAEISGAPLVHEGEIFVAARNRSLYRLDRDTGRLKEQMTFSQDIVGPPTVAPGGEHLLVAGQTALLYALSIRPLQVVAVTFADHAENAVAVPLLTMGRLMLLCDNDRINSCQLRVFDATNPHEALVEAKPVRIDGQVFDRPVLRGSQLVVVSSGERLQAFAVNDDPEKKGLALIGNYKVQEGYAGPMQLALGPDQQFWLASSSFRRFLVSNDSLRADPNSTAPGIASQPLQIIGEQFFVGRRPPYARGVILTQVDRERMAGSWRAVVGARFLAWTPSRNEGIVAVSETGTVFTLTSARLQQAGVELRAGTPLEIPADVIEPLGATRLDDGRLAVWCSGSQPKLWLINTLGQIESEVKLEAPLAAAPVRLKQGLILPLPGRLKFQSATRDGPRVQDYAAPVEEGAAAQWAYLLPLDDTEFLVGDREGRLSRMQIRQGDVVHLAEAAKFPLPQPVDIPPALVAGDLWIADASGTLYQLDGRSFDIKGQRTFPTSLRGVWTDGSDRYVQLLDGTVHCVSPGEGLPDRWTTALEGLALIGPPLRAGEQLAWADRNGTVIQLDVATGHERSRVKLPQPLARELLPVGGWQFASAIDGAVYRVAFPPGENP